HKPDTIEPYAAGLTEVEKWCARATSEASLDLGTKWVRTAYFYVPDLSMPPVLPIGTSGLELIGQCRLGLIWSEIEDADAQRAEALGRELRELLMKPLGPGDTDVKFQWWASGFWRNSVLWKNDRLSIITASTNWPAWRSLQSRRPTRLFLAAAGPATNVNFERPSRDEFRAAYVVKRQRVALRVDEALKIAALGSDFEQ